MHPRNISDKRTQPTRVLRVINPAKRKGRKEVERVMVCDEGAEEREYENELGK